MSPRMFLPRDTTAIALGADDVAAALRRAAVPQRLLQADAQRLRVEGPRHAGHEHLPRVVLLQRGGLRAGHVNVCPV